MNVEEFLNSPNPPIVLATLADLVEQAQAGNATLRLQVGALMGEVKKLREEINDLHERVGDRERRKKYGKAQQADKWPDGIYWGAEPRFDYERLEQYPADADMERKKEKIKEIIAELKIKKT